MKAASLSAPAERLLDDCRALLDAAARAGAAHAELHSVREAVDGLLAFADGSRTERVGTTVTTRLRVRVGDRRSTVLLGDPAADDPRSTAALAVALAHRSCPVRAEHRPPTAPGGLPNGLLTNTVTNAALPDPALPQAARLAPLTTVLAAHPGGPAALGIEHVRTHRCTVIARGPDHTVGFEHTLHHVWHWREGLGGHRIDGLTAGRFTDLDFANLRARIGEFRDLHAAGPKPFEHQVRVRVLLRPEVAAHLVRSLGFLLCAGNVLSGMRPLLERIGRRIAAPAVTLLDDPRMPGGSESAPVDAEGIPTSRQLLIEKGHLRGFLTGQASATALGVTPSGATRCADLTQRAVEGPSNIILNAGGSSPAEMRGRLADGIEAVTVVRPGGIRGRRGTFVTEVLGWRVRGGQRVCAVGPLRLSLGIFELLRSIEATGNDPMPSYLATGAQAPSVLVNGMEVG